MPASPSEPRGGGGGGGKWRRRTTKPTISKRKRPHEDEDDDNNDDDHTNNNDNDIEADEDEDLHPNPNSHQKHQNHQQHHQLQIQHLQLQQQKQMLSSNQLRGLVGSSLAAYASVVRDSEVFADAGVRISDFPAVVRRTVTRYHSSVMGIIAMERAGASGDRDRLVQLQQQLQSVGGGSVLLENLSYGQMQALSAVSADNPVLVGLGGDQEGATGSFVITPPGIMEGKGIIKKFWNGRAHVVPKHADWFSLTTVHRLERQVVPHFFSDKSTEHTPERYLDCRNLIVVKYIENPEKRLSISECQGLAVAVGNEDLSRIFRFLEHWGIINYCAAKPNQESWSVDSYLREDPSGEVHVPSVSLKSIDSLIKFDKPKCRLKPCDVYSSLSSHCDDLSDLDSQIRGMLSENCCSYCAQPLLILYYQSVKEADILLCVDCYHESRFIIGHSSIDFTRVESTKDYSDPDAESWTDEETLLLLEALELYTDNWNEIADHVATKSKAQCILHFLRLPMEHGLLENLDVPVRSMASNGLHDSNHERSFFNSNGEAAGHSNHDSHTESRLPFEDSDNPVMSLVSFLASAVGPRVAAACAHASLAALSEDDSVPLSGNPRQMDELVVSTRINSSDGLHTEVGKFNNEREDLGTQGSLGSINAEVSLLSAEKMKTAAEVGLSAAAMKAKLFADHEEREIQRLSANIINHQLKMLELKLKQFAEVETLLMKECEQVEKARQRFSAERACLLAARFGDAGLASTLNSPPSMVNNNTGNKQPILLASPSQPSISGYGNLQVTHPNLPLMAQQQQVFGYGQRLPLSAIHPSSVPSSSLMFNAPGSAVFP